MVVDKERKEAVLMDITVPNDSNIEKQKCKNLEKYKGLEEKLEKMWKVKVNSQRCDSQTGRVASRDHRRKIQYFSPEDGS